jgi:hypothetical protein
MKIKCDFLIHMLETPLRARNLPEMWQLLGFFRNRQARYDGLGKIMVLSDSGSLQPVRFSVEGDIMISGGGHKHFQCS